MNYTTEELLESLQNDLSTIVDTLGLEDGTNFSDIKQMTLDGDITTGGGGGGTGLDWSAIGYSSTPTSITAGYNYAKQIYDNWDDSVGLSEKYWDDRNLVIFPLITLGETQGDLSSCFRECHSLIEIAPIDMSYVNNITNCFNNCYALKYVPVFDLSSMTQMRNVFTGCHNLTDSALDNILQSCITATQVASKRKNLLDVGLESFYYPASRIQTLPHYQDFINAGWTIGY